MTVASDYFAHRKTGNQYNDISKYIVTGPPTRSVGSRLVTVAAVCHRLSSVGVCNTAWRACSRLHPRRPGDDVMPHPV